MSPLKPPHIIATVERQGFLKWRYTVEVGDAEHVVTGLRRTRSAAIGQADIAIDKLFPEDSFLLVAWNLVD